MTNYIADDPLSWTWWFRAMHAALQGACVCHLTTSSDHIGATTDRSRRAWQEFWERRESDPETVAPDIYLMDLPGLLKAVRKPNSCGEGGVSAGIPINDSELECLKGKQANRNQLMHFAPMGWVIYVGDSPVLAALICRIITDIIDAGWAFRHLDDNATKEMRHNLEYLASCGWFPEFAKANAPEHSSEGV